MSTTERLQATGSRGEAIIIVKTESQSTATGSDRSASGSAATYRLATGERLKQTDELNTFETLDGSRRFKLRYLRPTLRKGRHRFTKLSVFAG